MSGHRTVFRCPPGTDLLVEKQQSLFLEIKIGELSSRRRHWKNDRNNERMKEKWVAWTTKLIPMMDLWIAYRQQIRWCAGGGEYNGKDLELQRMMKKTLSCEDRWKAIHRFIRNIMMRKENEDKTTDTRGTLKATPYPVKMSVPGNMELRRGVAPKTTR